MKNVTLLLLLISFLLTSAAADAGIVVPATTTIIARPETKKTKLTYKETKKLLESKLNRKLSFKEKLALRLQKTFPKYDIELERRANNQAVTGFVLSVCGLVLLWPLVIPGLIISNSALRKERMDPGILDSANYGLAKAGSIIGYVGLALAAILIAIIAVTLSTGVYW
ncbi:MAG: DUF4190 domain-containing protein [Chitinophagaceae bacterium]|nr:DUF4190 domain-containing protein [Chitinophagaceae bacterium]